MSTPVAEVRVVQLSCLATLRADPHVDWDAYVQKWREACVAAEFVSCCRAAVGTVGSW